MRRRARYRHRRHHRTDSGRRAEDAAHHAARQRHLVIESQINEAHVRIYRPGRKTSTPAGQGGAVTMTTKWEGRALVSEGAMKAPNGDTTT